ncbi:MAG: hypothetical protein QM500_20490 [Methylococcales bacterium]
MECNQWFTQGNKNWFRQFAETNGITLKQLRNDIFPHTPSSTLKNLWQGRYAATGSYADALTWYAQAKHKNWE